jgi:hypothetical protein
MPPKELNDEAKLYYAEIYRKEKNAFRVMLGLLFVLCVIFVTALAVIPSQPDPPCHWMYRVRGWWWWW